MKWTCEPMPVPNTITLPLKARNAPSPKRDESQSISEVQEPILTYLHLNQPQEGSDGVDFHKYPRMLLFVSPAY